MLLFCQLYLKISEKIFRNLKIDVEVIDLRTISPLDKKTIIKSSKKTRNVLVLDPSWHSFGASAEIISTIIENCDKKQIAIKRLAYPDGHTPASSNLEKKFYLSETKIIREIKNLLKK